jgi:hypothetical protein
LAVETAAIQAKPAFAGWKVLVRAKPAYADSDKSTFPAHEGGLCLCSPRFQPGVFGGGSLKKKLAVKTAAIQAKPAKAGWKVLVSFITIYFVA